MRLVLTSFLLTSVLTGCTTSRVYHRPLSEVSHAIETLKPQMVAEVSAESQKVEVTINQIPDVAYSFHVQDVYLSGAFPYLTVQAKSRGANETKVVVTRMASNKGSSYGVVRRRDLEHQTLNALTEKLENKP
jgi:hypothetical protein